MNESKAICEGRFGRLLEWEAEIGGVDCEEYLWYWMCSEKACL